MYSSTQKKKKMKKKKKITKSIFIHILYAHVCLKWGVNK